MMNEWGILHVNGDQEVTLELTANPQKLTRDQAYELAFHLNSFVADMDSTDKPKLSAEGAEQE